MYNAPPPAAPVAGRRKLPGMKSEDVEVRSVHSRSVESASDPDAQSRSVSNSVSIPGGSPGGPQQS